MIHAMDKRIAAVLVELDVSQGPPTKIDIVWGQKIVVQRLDYLKIPFWCHYYRDMGHLKDRCPKILYGDVSFDSSEYHVTLKVVAMPIPVVGPALCSYEVLDKGMSCRRGSPTPYEGISKDDLHFIESVKILSSLNKRLSIENGGLGNGIFEEPIVGSHPPDFVGEVRKGDPQ